MSRKIAVIIPARYGSKRFEGKPLALIGGKPMIQRVYERARQSVCRTQVVVATDDIDIAETIRAAGGYAVMTSTAHKSGTDRVAEAARKLQLEAEDIVVNVQGDQPLLNPRSIDDVVGPLLGRCVAEMATLAVKLDDVANLQDPNVVKVIFDNQGFALYFSRSPIPYLRDRKVGFDAFKHVGTYAYTVRFLEKFNSLPEGRLERVEKLEQLRALENGHRIVVTVTGYDSPSVDVPGDIAKIEKLLKDLKDADTR